MPMSDNVRSRARSSTARASLFIAVAAVAWGTSGIAGRFAGDLGIAPLTVAAARIIVAALVLLPLAAATGAPAMPARRGARVGVVAVGVLLAGYQAAYFSSVRAAGVTVATLVALGLAPVLVAVASPLAGDARPDRRTWTAVALAVLGLLLLVGGAGAAVPADGNLALGVAFGVVCALGFSGVNLVGRTLGDVAPLRLVAVAFGVGGVLMAPVVLVHGAPDTARGMALLGYLGVVPTAVAYVLFFRGVSRVPATASALLVLLEPVTAGVLAVGLLGERLTATGIVGAVTVLSAVLLVRRAPRPQPTR